MNNAFNTYNKSISHSSVLSSIFLYLQNANVPYDTKELLRAEYVMIVSAFDTYFHNCVLKRMIEMFNGQSTKSKGFEKFKIPLEKVCLLIEEDNPILRLGIIQDTIREINQEDSYQGPKAIEYAMSLMGKKGVWSYLSSNMSISCDDIKRNLSLIIRRRNQIAHESDINFTTNEKNDITEEDVNHAKQYLTQIVTYINQWVTESY